MNILLVGNEPSTFAALAERLGHENDIRLFFADSGAAGLRRLRENSREKGKKAMDLVVVDQHLTDMTGIGFIRRLVPINPLVHTAVVGSLPDEAFHEATEGLGVLLQLPPQPREHDADMLLARFRKITGLMQPETLREANP